MKVRRVRREVSRPKNMRRVVQRVGRQTKMIWYLGWTIWRYRRSRLALSSSVTEWRVVWPLTLILQLSFDNLPSQKGLLSLSFRPSLHVSYLSTWDIQGLREGSKEFFPKLYSAYPYQVIVRPWLGHSLRWLGRWRQLQVGICIAEAERGK